MTFDITKMVEEIATQVKENREEFIIETIHPYCEDILQIKINKEELKQILLNGMQKQQPYAGWIPVSERLPNDEDYVLVCYEDGHIRTAYYYIDTNIYPPEFEDCCETGWYNYNEDFMYEQDVVAWMSLPQPYAESEDRE